MRHHSTVLLLSFSVLAASCGKNNYAQVEPDDLYFTHKDRKAALTEPSYNNSPLITAVEPLEEPAEYNQNDYANQHSPVLVSPGLGSPTIKSPLVSTCGNPFASKIRLPSSFLCAPCVLNTPKGSPSLATD